MHLVVRAYQHQVGKVGGTAVFPVPEVMGVQATGRSATGNRARGIAVLEGTTKPAADRAGCSAGADDLTGALEPDLTAGITGQIAAVGIRQQRTQMQRRGALLHIDVHHHGGVLPMGPARRLGVPAGLHQPHKRLHAPRQRRRGS